MNKSSKPICPLHAEGTFKRLTFHKVRGDYESIYPSTAFVSSCEGFVELGVDLWQVFVGQVTSVELQEFILDYCLIVDPIEL